MNKNKKDSEKEEKVDKIKKLKEEIEKHQEEKKDYLNGWKRTKADLENLKKRHREEKKKIADRTEKEILLNFLEVIDDFERLEKELEDEDEKSYLCQGVKQIRNKFDKLLEKYNIKKIETDGQEFDPRYHEALEHVENDQYESDMITEEVKPGYQKGDEVLRPAQVKVAS